MALVALTLSVLVLAPAPPSLSVKDVMQRVERYVAGYGEQASIVVCTEHYAQQASSGAAADAARTLVSDFAIVYAGAIRGWMGFRDVIEVDGHRVSDREDRLARVLMGAQGRFDEARRLSDESARFNIGVIGRTFNVPTAALFFFSPDNRDRFTFVARRVLGDGTWEIAFRETVTPTLIRSPEGHSVRSFGTIWVEPDSGTIVRTRLEAETVDGHGTQARRVHGYVDVTYRRVDALEMWLPEKMDEWFEASRQQNWDRVSGRAEYSEYRRFTTSARIK
jgi:hypothetical protein